MMSLSANKKIMGHPKKIKDQASCSVKKKGKGEKRMRITIKIRSLDAVRTGSNWAGTDTKFDAIP